MKNLVMLILLTTVSCASKTSNNLSLKDQILELEVKTFKEINDHSQELLETHPELSDSSKKKIKVYLEQTMKEHQRLKDEESKVVQLLLQNSLKPDKESKTKDDDQKELKNHFLKIYENKSSNLFNLISHIKQMADQKEIDESVKRDIQLLIRDFR